MSSADTFSATVYVVKLAVLEILLNWIGAAPLLLPVKTTAEVSSAALSKTITFVNSLLLAWQFKYLLRRPVSTAHVRVPLTHFLCDHTQPLRRLRR